MSDQHMQGDAHPEDEGFESGDYVSGDEDAGGGELEGADVMELHKQKMVLLEKKRQLIELLKAQGGEIPPEMQEELQRSEQQAYYDSINRKKRGRPEITPPPGQSYGQPVNPLYRSMPPQQQPLKRGRPAKKRKLGEEDDDDEMYFEDPNDSYPGPPRKLGRRDDGKRARTTWTLEENRILLRMLESGNTETQAIYDALRSSDPNSRKTFEHVKNKRANLSQKAAQKNTTVIDILRDDVQRGEALEGIHSSSYLSHSDYHPMPPPAAPVNGQPGVDPALTAAAAGMAALSPANRRGPGRPRKADFTGNRFRMEPGVAVSISDVAAILTDLKMLQETDRKLIITQSKTIELLSREVLRLRHNLGKLMKHHNVEEEDLQFPDEFEPEILDEDQGDQPEGLPESQDAPAPAASTNTSAAASAAAPQPTPSAPPAQPVQPVQPAQTETPDKMDTV